MPRRIQTPPASLRWSRPLAAALFCTIAARVCAGPWLDLGNDSLHDTTNPGFRALQQPAEALSQLPYDSAGNKVNWVQALQQGYIKPRASLKEGVEIKTLDQDVIMPHTSTLPMVRFPHQAHTRWLDCGNCHDKIFNSKAGTTPVNMGKILEGQYCGVCHGAIAFPLTECNRCHSVRNPAAKPAVSSTP